MDPGNKSNEASCKAHVHLKASKKIIWYSLFVDKVMVGAIGMSRKIATEAAIVMSIDKYSGDYPKRIALILRGYRYSMSRDKHREMREFFFNAKVDDEITLDVELSNGKKEKYECV